MTSVLIIYYYDTSNVNHAFCGECEARRVVRAACAGRGEVAIDARAQYEWMDPLPLHAIRAINGPHVVIDNALI